MWYHHKLHNKLWIIEGDFILRKICFALAIVLLLCGCSSRTYEDGYEDGYRSGYSSAEAELEYKIDEEWYDGYEFGYEEGYYEAEKEYKNKYGEGHDDGYYEGSTYTCLFFGDIDRAFRCAKNGCAWRTFIAAYDEFISDIYETEDEESSLFWAFVSVIISEDANDEEIALLVETFGSELFVRNGINLNP